MKQTAVIKVPMIMHCPKSRSRAMKIAVGSYGVESAALKGNDKDQIQVIGDGIDVAKLTRLLARKIGYAVLESLSTAAAAAAGGDKPKENKVNDAKMEVVWPPYHAAMPLYHNDTSYHVVREHDNYRCSIM
ncbi:hypothetical protein ACOSP7_019956 [Xanthoceras sorbifolium]